MRIAILIYLLVFAALFFNDSAWASRSITVPISPQPTNPWLLESTGTVNNTTYTLWLECDLSNMSSAGTTKQSVTVDAEKVNHTIASPYYNFMLAGGGNNMTSLKTITFDLDYNQTYSWVYRTGTTPINAPSGFVLGIPHVIKITVSPDTGAVIGQCTYDILNILDNLPVLKGTTTRHTILINGGRPF